MRWSGFLVCAALALGCSGRSVVGGPAEDASARDATLDATLDGGRDGGLDAPAPDVPAVDVPPSRCTSDQECAGNELGLRVCDLASGRCVACTPTRDVCNDGTYCDPAGLRCVAGCRDDMACARSSGDGGVVAERCNTATRQCVACTADSHCPPGNVCAGNQCVPGCNAMQGCPSGRSCCSGACVDTQSNTDHCGACGTVCMVPNAAAACTAGACAVAMCTGANGDCDANPANGCETDTNTATAHCGRCGQACATRPNTRAACEGGACAYSCLDNFADCDGVAENGCEVDLRSSAAHCGRCMNACTSANGAPVCSMGVCGLGACAENFGNCDGSEANGCETDVRGSLDHCGRCNNACPMRANGAATCNAGACGVRCNAGFDSCDGDASNGCETALDTTVAHCGACGTACPARANATATCAGGACGFACNTGFADCDGNAANGCEVDTRTSVTHCGRCANACPGGANSAPSCSNGACGLGCNAGFGDCDGNPATGCETALNSTDAHCGRCGNTCAAGRSCMTGACVLVCPSGQLNCNDMCVNPLTSNTDCGRCGNACTGGLSCEAGVCCGARERNCGGTCRDLNTDNNNCGGCGIVCGAGTTCLNGTCESTQCLPTRACSGNACNTCGSSVFTENWEGGSALWRTTDNGAIQLMTDSSACRGTFMRETVLASGGRTFLRRGVPVRPGQVHCLAAWIRGSNATQPFVGINASDANGSVGSEHWLIGARCYTTSGLGPPVSPVNANSEWRWYAREFVMPNYSFVVIKTEIFSGGAAGTADFDAIQLIDGPCPQAPPTICAAATCD